MRGQPRLVFLHYSRGKRRRGGGVVVAVRERKSVNETEGCKARHLLDLMETISNAALLVVHQVSPASISVSKSLKTRGGGTAGIPCI
jgi:hypothetical protein